MTRTLLRAGMLSCALLATTSLTAPAQAQLTPPAPVRQSIDGNGVDLFLGTMNVDAPALTMGQGDQGLSYRQLNRGYGWSDDMVAALNESGGVVIVSLGAVSDAFTVSGSTFTATQGNGATLSLNTGTNIYTYTRADGTVIRFDKVRTGTYPYYANRGRAIDVTRPSGARLSYGYDSFYYCSSSKIGGMGYICTTHAYAYRVATVRNSYGYRLAFNYAEIEPYNEEQPEILPDFATWSTVIGATATNLAVASGASTPSQSFGTTYSGGVPSFNVTDAMGRVTSYRMNAGLVAGMTLPGSGSEDVTIAYSGGRVSSVTSAAAGATSYAASDAGGERTITVTDALSHATVYVFDIASGRVKSVTDALGRTTSFQHDGSGRPTQITRPEGNYTQLSYDARGNVTETRAVAKSGSGLSDIVTSAVFPSTCTNVATCNQPTSTTDARGNVTDYTYDSGHGGALTVTAPAPTGGAARPQTRFAYTSLQAYFKNPAGSIVASGEPVARLTGTSACQTGAGGSPPSCAGTADEIVTSTDYGPQTTGTGNNLLPVSSSSGAGDASLTATTAMAYDDVGNLLTVDGSLAGSADTARARYDANRRMIGTVGPDPDGGGSLKHRAQRTTYNNAGQPNAVEIGTVNSQSDGDWASMTVLERAEQDYDSGHRPSVQRLTSGGTTYALTQASYDAAGRPECAAQRMNPSEFASLPADACTLDTEGSYGPDRIVRTTRDAANQVTLVQTGYGVSGVQADEMATTYRNNGQAETVTDAEANRTTYVYDGHDRLSRTRMPDPSTDNTSSTTDYEELTYDAGSNVTNRRVRDGNSIAFAYDNLSRLTAKDLPGSELDVSYSYDLLGRMLTAATSAQTLSFTFDALGRNLTQVSPLGTVTSAWDLAGRRTRLTYPGGTFTADYDHLVTGEVSAVRENGATSGVGVLATYAYDDRGRRTSLTRGNGNVTTYNYDNVSRLTQLASDLSGAGGDLTIDLSHNPASQIVTNTRSNDAFAFAPANVNRTDTIDGLNRVTQSGSAGITHDARGNITAVPGALSGLSGTLTFGYDSENRMTSAAGGRYAPGTAMAYDPLGRLYSETSWISPHHAYDGHSSIADYEPDGDLIARTVYGPGDEPVMSIVYGTRLFYIADERGSVIATTNSSGALAAWDGVSPAINSYDEYGVSPAEADTRFQYTGQVWLAAIADGIYYYRARIYHAGLGRFMQTDPIGYGGGMNLYAYVMNDPVNFTDPSGLLAVDCFNPANYEHAACAIEITGRLPGDLPGLLGNVLVISIGLNTDQRDGSTSGAEGQDPCNAPLPDGSTVNQNVDRIRDMLRRLESARLVGESFNGSHGFVLGAWLARIQRGGVWDYKLQPGGNQAQGNLNYGATGILLLPLDFLLRGAGAVQDPSTRGSGHWYDRPPSDYGDQAIDIDNIRRGARECRGARR